MAAGAALSPRLTSAQTAYTAPALGSKSYEIIPLTVTATCDGPTPVTASAATQIMMLRAQNLYQPGVEVEELASDTGFSEADSVAANPTDGSCWVADLGAQQLIHLAANGSELWRSDRFAYLSRLALNTADGSVWASAKSGKDIVLVHLASDGTELFRGVVLTRTCNVGGAPDLAVNPADGSVWVGTGCGSSSPVTLHLNQDGQQLSSLPYRGYAIAVSPTDGSVWISDACSNHSSGLIHLSAAGQLLGQIQNIGPGVLAVNPADGSCWYSNCSSGSVVINHASSSGQRLASFSGGFENVWSLSVNPTDGSVWVTDYGNSYSTPPGPGRLVLLSSNGTEVYSLDSLRHPAGVSVNPADGSVWVADAGDYDQATSTYVGNSKVVHLGVHLMTVDASAFPAAVFSGGTCQLAASAVVSTGSAVATWSWSDGGAGGSFSDPTAQNPTYTAPANPGGSDLSIVLTVTATSADASPMAASDSLWLVVHPVAHQFAVTARASSFWVASGGAATLTATATDSEGHGVASWSWSDGGKGGQFSDPTAQNPTYTAPANTSNKVIAIPLTVTATCDGPSPLTGSGATLLMVRAVQFYQPEEIGEVGDADWVSSCVSSLSVNPVDGSFLAASSCPQNPVLISFAADGSRQWESEAFPGVIISVSVNPADGSSWAAVEANYSTNGPNTPGEVAHLSSAGQELWRSTNLTNPLCVSVNPSDGSCWVADQEGWNGSAFAVSQVLHLAADGSELWHSPSFSDVLVALREPGGWFLLGAGHGRAADRAFGGRWFRAVARRRPQPQRFPVGG